MATGGCEQISDEIFNLKCSPCLANNRTREAVTYCIECEGYCCQSCTDIHNGLPGLKGHNLRDKTNYQSFSVQTDLLVMPTERCVVHGIKYLDMFCGNHDVVGCTTCMALEHRNCADVQSIREVVDAIFQKSDFMKSYEKLLDMKTAMEKVSETRECLLRELNTSKTEAVKAITDFRRGIETILEHLEKASLEELENEFVKKKSILEQELKKAEHEINSMKQAVDDMKKSEGNYTQQFVCMKTAQKKVTQTEDISTSLNTSPDAKVVFTANTAIHDFLQGRNTLGQANCHSSDTVKPRTTMYSIKSSREMNVKLPNDANVCSAYGSCLTADGMLLLADSNNAKLKRVDVVKLSIVDQCVLPTNPYSVCCTSEQEAVVSLANKTIQFVSLDYPMTQTHRMKLSHDCFGIVHKNGRLYITDNQASVYIHDKTGKLLQTVPRDSFGNHLFGNSRHIALSETGDKMYVAEWLKGLITLDGQGRHINTFSDSKLVYASGVCTDRRGNVFISGRGSNNVLQIGHDRNNLGVVVQQADGIESPESICFHPQQCALIVIQWNSDTVKIFHLQ